MNGISGVKKDNIKNYFNFTVSSGRLVLKVKISQEQGSNFFSGGVSPGLPDVQKQTGIP
jgi:hypothetical protein